jgi:hypothetical protein
MGCRNNKETTTKSDDGMVCVEFLRVESNPDTHAHTCYCDAPGDDHPAGVGPNKAFEAEETHGHGAERNKRPKAVPIRTACAIRTFTKSEGIPPELLAIPDEPEPIPGDDAAAVVATNRFGLFPPRACWRLKFVSPILLWNAIGAVTLSEAIGCPLLYAQIQLEDASVKLIEPADQLLQFEPR